MRCPVCYGLINRRATKCKHCHTTFDENDDYLEYLNNGFSLIERECNSFEEKIDAMKGSFFQRHSYSEEELNNSKHLETIKSIIRKMSDDINNWKGKQKLSVKLESLYESRIYMAEKRINHIINRIKNRPYTIWERVAEFCLFSYYLICNIALSNIKGFAPNIKDPSKFGKPFRIINKAFEGMNNKSPDNEGEEEIGEME